MSSSQNYVTSGLLLRTAYAMIATTTLVFVGRAATRIWRPKRIMAEDYILLLAYLFFLSTTILYIVVTPTMYRVSDVVAGKIPPYAELADDSLFMIKIFFANSMMFWFTLWSVKFAFLALYYRLMTGIKRYMQLWWGVLAFSVLTLIGCIVSNFTSCHSMHAWFTPGLCSTPRDVRAQIASLYYAFATDVLTDLMVMFLPIGLIWNLQRPTLQKVGMGVLFGIGWICIAMAIIRVVQIGSKAGNASTPSSSWLAFWAIIESAIAVIIGCGPGLYSTAKEVRNTRKGGTYGSSGVGKGYAGRYMFESDGYRRQRSGGDHRGVGLEKDDTELVGIASVIGGRPPHRKGQPSMDIMDYGRRDAASSQEQLNEPVGAGQIQVKRTVEVNELELGQKRASRQGYNW
ncbi:uncharacterized protein HMPREF1541_11010 [Cyphellophora europaea CBS 101466]|uniref:Rhodopsin domain-containing protein n=1 Tax=Cyphellophora europaea (strain CBS 101466) TaxID=1220924 RepID=W2S7K5_CYPE1|nr:uncharacterized protein HMPREF1541_11010 [Cyphellophora europaea CBS 101466]ETN43879.1 hypothetical protein HMPREF1541_11010 [Cyphellophora europaea CBS 101466]